MRCGSSSGARSVSANAAVFPGVRPHAERPNERRTTTRTACARASERGSEPEPVASAARPRRACPSATMSVPGPAGTARWMRRRCGMVATGSASWGPRGHEHAGSPPHGGRRQSPAHRATRAGRVIQLVSSLAMPPARGSIIRTPMRTTLRGRRNRFAWNADLWRSLRLGDDQWHDGRLVGLSIETGHREQEGGCRSHAACRRVRRRHARASQDAADGDLRRRARSGDDHQLRGARRHGRLPHRVRQAERDVGDAGFSASTWPADTSASSPSGSRWRHAWTGHGPALPTDALRPVLPCRRTDPASHSRLGRLGGRGAGRRPALVWPFGVRANAGEAGAVRADAASAGGRPAPEQGVSPTRK